MAEGLEKDVIRLWTDNSIEAKKLKSDIREQKSEEYKIIEIFSGSTEPSMLYKGKGIYASGYNNIRSCLC